MVYATHIHVIIFLNHNQQKQHEQQHLGLALQRPSVTMQSTLP